MNNDCEFLEMFISLSGVEALLKTKHGYANGGSCFKLSFVAVVRRRSVRRCWLLLVVCVLLDYARYWTVLREAASLGCFVVELSN